MSKDNSLWSFTGSSTSTYQNVALKGIIPIRVQFVPHKLRQRLHLDEEDEVLLVLGLAAPLARVLPVQVEAVKVVSLDKGESGAGEGSPGAGGGRHL